MFQDSQAFSGYSIDDLAAAKKFYSEVLGIKVTEGEIDLKLSFPNGQTVFLYQKDNHEPATFTVLNFPVDDVDAAVDELVASGVIMERYGDMQQDEKGVLRGKAANEGPDIAWFKDPAGNVLSVLSE